MLLLWRHIFYLVLKKYLGNTMTTKKCQLDKVSFTQLITSLSPLIFLLKHISLYALGRLKWILDIFWPFNQHFNLKNQRNGIKQVLMINFWNDINCILLHWQKKTTLHLHLCGSEGTIARTHSISGIKSRVVKLTFQA